MELFLSNRLACHKCWVCSCLHVCPLTPDGNYVIIQFDSAVIFHGTFFVPTSVSSDMNSYSLGGRCHAYN